MTIYLAEPKVLNASRAALVHNIMSQEYPNENEIKQTVNRFQYNAFWLRDGAFHARMYAIWGRLDDSEKLLRHFLKYQDQSEQERTRRLKEIEEAAVYPDIREEAPYIANSLTMNFGFFDLTETEAGVLEDIVLFATYNGLSEEDLTNITSDLMYSAQSFENLLYGCGKRSQRFS
jgi:hypothetical protein